MLTRRYLRIKVLQELFTFFTSPKAEFAQGEKKLLENIDRIFDVYIYQLSYLIELSEFAKVRMEEAKNKFFPTEEEQNPNLKFTENKFLKQISDNRAYKMHYDRLHINWSDESELLRTTWSKIKESKQYSAYLYKKEDSYDADKNFVKILVNDFLIDDELFISFLEDKNINWINDYDAALIMIDKSLKQFDEQRDEYSPLPKVYTAPDSVTGRNEDRDFVRKLYRTAIFNSEEYNTLIGDRAQNWDFDRIALMDIIIIKMAITEFTEFDSIPTKVTMNEYIELSKVFSTPKSKKFINGILDKLLGQFEKEGKVKKIGRGLLK
ncbi:MAG: transcription antitermination factor NusB [Bacteroidota bacterium]|nr:transcription antitermination factor NusB [Bacteroidota bacterium]